LNDLLGEPDLDGASTPSPTFVVESYVNFTEEETEWTGTTSHSRSLRRTDRPRSAAPTTA
jgi:hypothetical protein